MAEDSFSCEAIVLGKTRLGEADLILRMIAQDGQLVEAVAKGARKPTSASSARLELANRVELLVARGRGLGIVKETRLVSSHRILHEDPAYGAAAACICELAAKMAHPGLESPRAFGLVATALESIAAAPRERLALLVSAYILKASAMSGSRPSLETCVSCGRAWPPDSARPDKISFSLIDGGIVCDDCAAACETERMPQAIVRWAQHLLMSRFEDMESSADDARLGEDLAALADRWVATQFGFRLKALRSLVQYCAL